jgi:CSLREA domain-containing protein
MQYIRLFVAAIAVAVLALSLGGTVSYASGSQTFTVTRNDDPAPNGCQPNDCSLREAILAANDTVDADTITVPAMHIPLSIEGTGEDAGQTGDLDITHDVTINGAGPDNTIIDADQIDAVFDIPAPASSAGVSAQSSPIVTLQDLSVTGGSAAGIHQAVGELTLENLVVLGNHNTNDGGGILSISGTLDIKHSTIFKNTATETGGGVSAGSALTITDSTINANSGDGGGGIAVYNDFTLANSTVTHNNSSLTGGGILIPSTATGNLINSTIADNTASIGGGVVNDLGHATMTNTIVSGNSGNGPDCFGTFGGNNNLVESTTNCILTGEGNITGQDPMLFDLADYGGPTQTRAIPDTSPAFDAGDAVSCPDADQRGVPRIQVSACDIGAFEFTFVGDVDCDGGVALPDIMALLGHVAGAATPGCIYRGDINCNLGYEGVDALFVLRHLAHLPEMTRPLSCPEIGPDPIT